MGSYSEIEFVALSSEAARWLLGLWLFVLGAAVGSFLNVVIHRLPRGMSLIKPGSHCPACNRPIRWFDNVPILSWIILLGRCRDCRAEISLRYPAVEASTALLFVVLGSVECFSGGANLPLRSVGAAWTFQTRCAVYAYHLVLFCTLTAAALISYDRRRLPLGLFLPALVVGLAAPLVWPEVHPVPACSALAGWYAGLSDAVAGLAVGWLCGRSIGAALKTEDRMGLASATAVVGLFLGW